MNKFSYHQPCNMKYLISRSKILAVTFSSMKEKCIYLSYYDYYSKLTETCRMWDKYASSVIWALKSIFVRHGIPHKFMADNAPYNTEEFKYFSNQYDFILKTSCPNYFQSNGPKEMGVKIAKIIFLKCKGPCLGLLEFHITPITGMSYSLSQFQLSWSIWSILPVINSTLKPAITKMSKMKFYYKSKNRNLIMIKQQNHYYLSKNEKSLEFGTKEYGTKLAWGILQEVQNPIFQQEKMEEPTDLITIVYWNHETQNHCR